MDFAESIPELTERMRMQSERAVRLYLEAMEPPDANHRPRPATLQAARRASDAEAIAQLAADVDAEARRARDRDVPRRTAAHQLAATEVRP